MVIEDMEEQRTESSNLYIKVYFCNFCQHEQITLCIRYIRSEARKCSYDIYTDIYYQWYKKI